MTKAAYELNHQMIESCDPRPLELRRLTLTFQFINGVYEADQFYLHHPETSEQEQLRFMRYQMTQAKYEPAVKIQGNTVSINWD